MKRVENILVVHDDQSGSEAALERAIDVASRSRASLTLIEIVEADATVVVNEYRKRHKRLLAGAQRLGIATKSCVEQLHPQSPHLDAVFAALGTTHDLVCASVPATRSPGAGQIARPTILSLLRTCSCPVWAIPARRDTAFKNVIAAVSLDVQDGSPTLDEKILELALSLVANQPDAQIQIVHAWMIEAKETGSRQVAGQWRQDLVAERRQGSAQIRLKQLIAKYDLDPSLYQIHLERATPAQLIGDTAECLAADLIVMGMPARDIDDDLLARILDETLLASTSAGILVVKPEGFYHPLQQNGTNPVIALV